MGKLKILTKGGYLRFSSSHLNIKITITKIVANIKKSDANKELKDTNDGIKDTSKSQLLYEKFKVVAKSFFKYLSYLLTLARLFEMF